jgi:hypothetical protein
VGAVKNKKLKRAKRAERRAAKALQQASRRREKARILAS